MIVLGASAVFVQLARFAEHNLARFSKNRLEPSRDSSGAASFRSPMIVGIGFLLLVSPHPQRISGGNEQLCE